MHICKGSEEIERRHLQIAVQRVLLGFDVLIHFFFFWKGVKQDI